MLPIFASASSRMMCDVVFNGGAVEADDDVAGAHAGSIGIRSLLHAEMTIPVRARRTQLFGESRRQRLQGDAGDGAALDFTELDELVHHVPREVAWHGEADALVAAGFAEDGRVDAHELAARVHQRAAGVAGIDCGVGLDEILVGREPPFEPAAGRADDAERDGLVELKRIPDRQDPFGDLELARNLPTASSAGFAASIFSTAMSVASSTPMTFARSSRLSGIVTVTSTPRSTTWLFVRT